MTEKTTSSSGNLHIDSKFQIFGHRSSPFSFPFVINGIFFVLILMGRIGACNGKQNVCTQERQEKEKECRGLQRYSDEFWKFQHGASLKMDEISSVWSLLRLPKCTSVCCDIPALHIYFHCTIYKHCNVNKSIGMKMTNNSRYAAKLSA